MGSARQFGDRGAVRFLESLFGRIDLYIFPVVVMAAWFYFPYCQTGPSLCLWKALFHVNCPGCGLTRGICFLVHGHVREAWAFNRLSPVAFTLFAVNFVRKLETMTRRASKASALL
jgi:Protein of unknown function (DUF2752)